MKNWQDTLVPPSATLREALGAIDRSASRIALVVDESRRLLGTLSDGDARRAFLAGRELEDPVHSVMSERPTVARDVERRSEILGVMRANGLHQIPLLDADGRVVGLATIDDLLTPPTRDEWVVIMAGGRGTRLRELTKDTPKPMLSVGGRPLLETVLRNFKSQGFERFWFAVNFKADQVESYFADGTEFGVQIEYLREEQCLGTAGALGLLPERPEAPIVLTNADLLTKIDYVELVDRHAGSGADATMAVREYEVQVPFGVVKEHGGTIHGIDEKPVLRSTVNAGIYVLAPRVLDLVEPCVPLDVTALFERIGAAGLSAKSQRVDGYWMDIGRMGDFERANRDFAEVFR